MAGTWTSERFPQFEKEIRRLVEQHRELEDEPLHLAIAYQPGAPRDQLDIYLFEVIGGLGERNPDKELFETTFEPNNRLQAGFSQRLHMTLTTPLEFTAAVEEKWKTAGGNPQRCALRRLPGAALRRSRQANPRSDQKGSREP